ncbi:MFS transporter [Desulfomonile tiedjei]|uniref:Sugar phosphate permease n=1 Tax=Desulfomonile tiedjei (strain ATCC 49306 / DSM 6799 / DCB-1) TaxID=706587 RepID=I4C1U4_DESTA|nr:MFS transporter [Desulfomonile tiedjei]AFM23535.1 sugar phosphate permease [Desulfomonile tiedjei DSM 6799]
MNESIKGAWGYRHVILAIVWLLYLINYFDRISVLTFLPYIQKDLSLNAIQLGWLASIFFFGYSLAQFLAGYLADRIGPKKTMNIAIWVFTIITGLTGLVRNYWQFIFLRLGLAVGEGQHFAPAIRMIANWFPRAEKGRANGFFSTTWAVAPAVVPIAVTQIAAVFFDGAWRPVFFALAVPGFIGAFLLWRYVNDSPKVMYERGKVTKEEYDLIVSSVDVEATEHGKTYSAKVFLTDIQFYLYTAGLVMVLMIYWGMTTWISTFLVKQHGMNLKTMGFYASLPYIVAFFSMFIGGWAADKWFEGKPKVVTVISFLGCIPTLYFIGQVPKGDTNMLLLWLAVGGFFVNLSWGMMYSFPGWRYPKELVGRAVGVSNGVGQFGAFLSPLVAAYLVVELPDKSFDFGGVFIFWSLLAIVGAVAISFLKEESILAQTAGAKEATAA